VSVVGADRRDDLHVAYKIPQVVKSCYARAARGARSLPAVTRPRRPTDTSPTSHRTSVDPDRSSAETIRSPRRIGSNPRRIVPSPLHPVPPNSSPSLLTSSRAGRVPSVMAYSRAPPTRSPGDRPAGQRTETPMPNGVQERPRWTSTCSPRMPRRTFMAAHRRRPSSPAPPSPPAAKQKGRCPFLRSSHQPLSPLPVLLSSSYGRVPPGNEAEARLRRGTEFGDRIPLGEGHLRSVACPAFGPPISSAERSDLINGEQPAFRTSREKREPTLPSRSSFRSGRRPVGEGCRQPAGPRGQPSLTGSALSPTKLTAKRSSCCLSWFPAGFGVLALRIETTRSNATVRALSFRYFSVIIAQTRVCPSPYLGKPSSESGSNNPLRFPSPTAFWRARLPGLGSVLDWRAAARGLGTSPALPVSVDLCVGVKFAAFRRPDQLWTKPNFLAFRLVAHLRRERSLKGAKPAVCRSSSAADHPRKLVITSRPPRPLGLTPRSPPPRLSSSFRLM